MMKMMMIAAFCHCIDWPELLTEESDDSFKCQLCDQSDEEYVCTVTFGDDVDDSDDEFVTTAYRGLRDVDGWQRRAPWGGSAKDVPMRVTHTSTST